MNDQNCLNNKCSDFIGIYLQKSESTKTTQQINSYRHPEQNLFSLRILLENTYCLHELINHSAFEELGLQ